MAEEWAKRVRKNRAVPEGTPLIFPTLPRAYALG